MWPALIQAGAGLIGGFMSSEQSSQNSANQIAAQEAMQRETEQYNAQQAGINRQFQAQQVNQQEAFQTNAVANQQAYETQMSNTAYQRASNDMKRAGLNPMMMFGSGSAASTPSIAAPSGSSASGSTASVGTPSVPLSQKQSPWANLGKLVEDSVGTAVQAKLFDKMTEAVATQKAETNLVAAQADTERQRPDLIKAQTGLSEEDKILLHKKQVGEDYVNMVKRNNVGVSSVDLHKAMMYDDLIQNPVTQNILKGGILGSSAQNMTGVVKDVLDSALSASRLGTAKKALADQLNKKYPTATENRSKMDDISKRMIFGNDNAPFFQGDGR